MVELSDILQSIKAYSPEANVSLIEQAFHFAKKMHTGQKRASGEPYFIHPLEVAAILVQMKMDVPTIIAGLLHDIIEDTPTSLDEIRKNFGHDVAYLVDGVTKISKIQFTSSQEKQAENFRKMILAMATDIRVIIIKLADRLNNMRTLDHLEEDRRVKIAEETMEIYAPLANRLGIQWMKVELEELSFKYLKPDIYQMIESKVSDLRVNKESYVEKIRSIVSDKLNEFGVPHDIYGRIKHNFSIYRKMESQNISFDQVHDLLAFRVIVNSIKQCYEVLGVIHELWKPVPGRFKDYIAMPKVNGYRSLHTTLVCLDGERAEFQIRTREMHEIAEKGIAAHWKYKEGGNIHEDDTKKFQWLRELLDLEKGILDPSEFLDTVKLDLFATDVYVFTPRGDLKELPYGSTPIDFAYSIHSELGNTCAGARVNETLVPLDYQLKSGDTVEIVSNKKQKPNKDWLKFVRTSRAKARIRLFIKHEQRDRSVNIGKELLEKEFSKFHEVPTKFLKGATLKLVLNKFELEDLEHLYCQLGYGKLRPFDVVSVVLPPEQLLQPTKEKETILGKIFRKIQKQHRTAVKVGGYNDILITLGKCCCPLPGEPIIGFITRGRGVTVHYHQCQKVLDSDPERRVDVEWDNDAAINHKAKIKVVSEDRPGVLASMTKTISNTGINISQASIRTSGDAKAINIFHLEINDLQQLQHVMRSLEKMKGVISVERIRS